MSKESSASAWARSPLKEPQRRESQEAADGEEEDERRPFETLIPGAERRSLFKSPKGRLGMG